MEKARQGMNGVNSAKKQPSNDNDPVIADVLARLGTLLKAGPEYVSRAAIGRFLSRPLDVRNLDLDRPRRLSGR
jgi:hypothetical protein